MIKNIAQVINDIGFDFGWSEEKVWKLDLPAIDMGIDQLIWHFDVPFFSRGFQKYCVTPMEIINNPANHQKEYQRMMRADLSYPLDVMENKSRLLLLDGLHRLMKAYVNGLKTVRVRVVPRSKILMIIKN